MCDLQLASYKESFVGLALLPNPSKPTCSGVSQGVRNQSIMSQTNPLFQTNLKGRRLHLLTRHQCFASGRQQLSREHFHQQELQTCSHLRFAFPFSSSFLQVLHLSQALRQNCPSSPLLLTPLEIYKREVQVHLFKREDN